MVQVNEQLERYFVNQDEKRSGYCRAKMKDNEINLRHAEFGRLNGQLCIQI